jgi:phosphatidylinositol alpha 1,6-mannosyltransferase
MRLAIFTETFLPKWDGIANTLCYLLKYLAERGHECLMFAPKGAPARYARTPIIGLPSMTFPFYRDLKLVPPLVDVEQELASFEPDIVHLVNLASLGLVGMRHAHDLGVPVVASYHTDLPGYARHYGMRLLEDPIWAYFRWLHNQADLNLCPSHFTKSELEAHDFERVDVWGRGVDTERFNPRWRDRDWRNRLTDNHPDSLLMLYVGRLAAEKRIDWLRPLLDIVPDARLAIVGEGPIREELEERFAGTHTVFTGFLKGMDLSRAYAAADLFVFPSASETLGNVVLEAMASGLPVIAAGAGGPVDHVRDGVNGFLSDPDDPADFAALAWRCITDPDLRHTLGDAARVYAETQTWELIFDGLIERYRALIQSGPQAPAAEPIKLGDKLRTRYAESRLSDLFRNRALRYTDPDREP